MTSVSLCTAAEGSADTFSHWPKQVLFKHYNSVMTDGFLLLLCAHVGVFLVLEQLSEDLPGTFYSIEELSQESEDRRVVMDSPPSSLIKIGVARDWPDARALWLVCLKNVLFGHYKYIGYI